MAARNGQKRQRAKRTTIIVGMLLLLFWKDVEGAVSEVRILWEMLWAEKCPSEKGVVVLDMDVVLS